MTQPTDLRLSEITRDVIKTFRRYDLTGTNKWTFETAIRDLPYQVGSLAKLGLQLSGDRYARGMARQEIIQKISDELADIIADTMFIAHGLEINVPQAWAAMLASDETKIAQRATSG